MAELCITVEKLMADAIKRRDELDVFIRLLIDQLAGKDFGAGLGGQVNSRQHGQQHSV